MTDRDELARIIDDTYRDDWGFPARGTFEDCADAILNAGYRKPRTITTVDELDALPASSVVRESDTEEVWFKASDAWLQPGRDWAYDTNCIGLPVTVLYVPEEQS